MNKTATKTRYAPVGTTRDEKYPPDHRKEFRPLTPADFVSHFAGWAIQFQGEFYDALLWHKHTMRQTLPAAKAVMEATGDGTLMAEPALPLFQFTTAALAVAEMAPLLDSLNDVYLQAMTIPDGLKTDFMGSLNFEDANVLMWFERFLEADEAVGTDDWQTCGFSIADLKQAADPETRRQAQASR